MGKTLQPARTRSRVGQRHETPSRDDQADGGLPGVSAERELPTPISITAICPTLNRQHLHESLYRVFDSQTYPHKDLWVMDDTGPDSPFFSALGDSDPRVHYVNLAPWHVTTGCKRNWLVEKSSGFVIAHFDDDDWYAPNYLSSMLERLVREDADLVKLGTWNEKRMSDGHRWKERPVTDGARWGYGFSYVYRRSCCSKVHMPDINQNEDIHFLFGLRRAKLRMRLIDDGAEWVEHRLHGTNTSRRA